VKSRIQSLLSESIKTKQLLYDNDIILNQLEQLTDKVIDAFKTGSKLIFAGNGGSFADSQHLSAEFVCRFMMDRNPLPSIALGTNSSIMTAAGNDYGYEKVFSRELEALGQKNDIFIAISTSGNSHNIIEAVKVAQKNDIFVMGWTGENGGVLDELCECIKIPSKNVARIQECHITIGHILCEIVEKELFN